MSLLLDALKKAAEQKAKKDGESASEGAVSAEPRVHDETRTELEADNEATEFLHETDQTGKEDTYLDRDQIEFNPTGDDNTVTGIDTTIHDIFDEDQTEIISTGGDGGRIFDEATEVATEIVTPGVDDYTESAADTAIHDIFNEDQTEVISMGDDTDRDLGEATEAVTFDSKDYTDLGEETIGDIFDEDRTLVLTDVDVTNFMGNGEASADETELTASGEDISLIQIDDESVTDSLDDGPKTGSLAANTEVQMLAGTGATTNKLDLEGVPDQDQTDTQDPSVTPLSDDTQTRGVSLGGMAKPKGPAPQDQTSTRTYAPDNYDRTLVKVADEDASGLFSGMKSETDVVMTPEYAKKVFVSKFSAQRMYQYRIYGAVAFGILIVIGILGLFELQQESLDIDNSLRPLKRDPMPGLIVTTSDQNSSLLGGTGKPAVDTLMLQLVENAEMESDALKILDPETAVEPNPEPEPEIVAVQSAEDEVVESSNLTAQPVVATTEPAKETITDIVTAELEQAPKQQLQITTSSSISDKDRWLREAYAAYQRGDDKTALARYNQVLEVDAGNRNALLARAAIRIQSNNVGAAIRDYQKLLLANPKDSLAVASLMAVANYSPEVAESQLKIMIRDEPDSPYLNFALANVYGAQDRWIEAQGLYFIALENNPNDPNYAYNLAVSLEHIEKPGVAIAYYERALDNFTNGLATFNRDVVDQRLEQLKQL